MGQRWARVIAVATALLLLAGVESAAATCTVPNSLTNGQTADASQVMGNFNALTTCINGAPAGSTNALQTNAGSGAFGSVGPLTNGQLVIGSTGATPAAAVLTPGTGISITNGAGAITIAATGSGLVGASGAPQGRLTLTSGSPVMSADVTGATSVYYDCYAGNAAPYYTGSADVWGAIAACEISTVLKASGTGQLNALDVFDVFFTGSQLCIATNGSGAGWSGDTGGSTTARGTGYSKLHNTRGYWTNASSLTHCYNGATDLGAIAVDRASYLGSIYTTAAGQTGVQFATAPANGGTAAVIGLFNAYNRVSGTTRVVDNAGGNGNSWTYASATWRAKDNSTANRISQVDGLGVIPIDVTWFQYAFAAGSSTYNNGMDCDSSTATPNVAAQSYSNINVMMNGADHCPAAIGFHYEQAMESRAEGAGTDIVYGQRDGSQTNALILNWQY